jgi:hypothetical protein
MRLGSWHRLGLVLSVVWFLGAGLYEKYVETARYEAGYASSYASCISADVDLCQLAARVHGDSFLVSWPYVALVALAPIIVAWISIYIIVLITNWIRRGFTEV